MAKLIFKEYDSLLEMSLNPWDSNSLRRSCYELDISGGRNYPKPESVLEFFKQSQLQTVTCRVPSNDFALRYYLQSLGFIHVELQLKCQLNLLGNLTPKANLGTLRLALDEDLDRVQDIASKIFLNSRFQYIPNIESSLIGKRFSNWVEQLQNEGAEYSYVLEYKDNIVGFFYSKPTRRENELYAALGGIADDCRGPFGIYLYPAVMSAYYESGIRNVISAIAADNLGALNLWARLGTKFPEAIDIFMWNIDQNSKA
ncbi:GNAT family N-acetyltransferase [Methylotuvimicrobium sp.]|uniref:GNAT family N-acetyltransferase n=1 Tax=Methylotuvimicrobium sp. TaxID=2822413 RepID=UPI003D64DB38